MTAFGEPLMGQPQAPLPQGMSMGGPEAGVGMMAPSQQAMQPPSMPAPPPPPRPEKPPNANLTFMKGFPHKKVRDRWEARVRFCRASYKQNAADYREALKWLWGGDEEHETSDASEDAKFSSQIWFADFNKLVSFYNNKTPRTICRPAKGPEQKPLADATAILSDRSAFETGEKNQDTLAIAEAICRNHGYVYCGWDQYRWLPKFPYIRGEVWLDPDCEGDIKSARFLIIEEEVSISDLLADDTIPASIRKKLREKKEARRRSRIMREGIMTDADIEKDYATTQDWDAQPDMDKVVCYKIFSRDGILPGEPTTDEREGINANTDSDVGQPANDEGGTPGDPFDRIQRLDDKPEYLERTSPHMVLRAPPAVLDDAEPAVQKFDPMDWGRRAYILLVAGFEQVLKVADWPMSHFDRDEFPVVECRPTRVGSLLHGIAIFRAIRPYLKIINAAIAFWIESERRGSKKIVEVPKGMEASEKEKYASSNMYEIVEVDEPGRVNLVEFAGRLNSYKELIPFLMQMHDDVSGINEAVSGKAAQVEETASANRLRMDQAIAALSYLETAIEQYHETKARMRVAALQCYVPARTEYAECERCGGAGFTDSIDTENGLSEPCSICGGTGSDRSRPLKKGADFWLPAVNAEAWRDDLSLEEIRAEVIVGVEPGSSRQDYAERRVQMLTTLADRYVPLFLQQGLLENARAIMREHILASNVPAAEEFVPTVEQLQEAAQRVAEQQAAAQGGQGGGGGKSPEELQLAAQKLQHEQQMAERQQRLEEAKAAAEIELKTQQVQIQAQQAQAQLIQAQAQAAGVQQQAMAAQEKAAADAQPAAVDPLKAAEFEHKSEIERERLAMECEKHEMDLRKAEAEAEAVTNATTELAALLTKAQQMATSLEQATARLTPPSAPSAETAPSSSST